MTSSLSRHLPLLLALLPQLFLALLAPGFVVCQEGSGEVSVEWSASPCCEDAPTLERTPDLPSLESSDDCDGCSDAALAVSLQRADSPAPVQALRLLARVPSGAWVPGPQRARAFVPPAAPPSAPATVLSTVRLRC